VLESASVSYGKATPYFPLIDLLKRYVHVLSTTLALYRDMDMSFWLPQTEAALAQME
jgi:hypothetical protein